MAVLFSRANKQKKKQAQQSASGLEDEIFCPNCGYEAKLIEIYKDRKVYKCTKCMEISTYTILPDKPNKTNKHKGKQKEIPGIIIRDRSKEKEKDKKEHTKEDSDPPTTMLQEIERGMESTQILSFEYVTKDGKKSMRRVEPYKITKDASGNIILYAFCLEGGGIRVFKLNGMKNIKSMEYTFKPRWPIENEIKRKKGSI